MIQWQVFSMQYFIYDKQGKKQALLQNCTSIQWLPKYWESGSFEIHARRTDDNDTYLVEGNRVVCTDRNEIGFITCVLYDADTLEVRGRLDNLERRINYGTATIRNIEKSLLQLVVDNKRGLDINVASPKGLTPSIKYGSDTSYDTLEESFKDYCQKGGLGWREVVHENILNYLEIYQGETKQNAVFSDDLGNIKSQSYEENMSEYKNFAFVLGEDTGDYRKKIEVDIRKDKSEEIRELYVDARDLQSTYKENGEEKTYTSEEYEEMLRERGISKLEEKNKNALKFEFELDPYSQISELGKDYDLGDIVVVKSTQYKILALARVTELKFVEEANQDTQVSITTEIESREVLQ